MNNNERLKLAGDWYNDQSTTNKEKLLLENLFPELKTGKDEQIRQEIIDYLHLVGKGDIDYAQPIIDGWIAWLEKQGETFTKRDVDDAYLKGICDAKRELEKQGEQNPVDKVEPKFKVRDWIVDNHGKVNQVITTNYRDEYIVLDDGSYFNRSECDNYHLWTIDDAKNGDVLTIGDEYFLFKKKKENTLPAVYISHCFADSAGAFRVTNGRDCGEFLSIENGIKACPATKEQREFLFNKMKEAGYEWDADKKGLVIVGIDNDDEDERYEELIEDDETSIKQKPAWNEEDEKILGKCIDAASGYYSPEDKQSMKDWLKSLKNRVGCEVNCTTIKQWSEEDEVMFQTTIDTLEDFSKGKLPLSDSGYDIAIAEIQWLKSLKPQPQWKPTEEQMSCFKQAIDLFKMKVNDTIVLNLLNSLYDELENLYEQEG